MLRKSHGWLDALALEIARFGLVGALRAAIGLLILFVPYNYFGVSYVICNIAAYSVGFLLGFVLHKHWVFGSKKAWRYEVLPYMVMFGAGYAANLGVLLLFAALVGFGKNVSQLLAAGAFTTINYVGNKFWTFRGRMSDKKVDK